MSEPFLGEVRAISFNFAPKGWALCNGQLMRIAQNAALFSILGTTYGGDGISTFALPDLQGRVPVHVGNGINLGDAGGDATHLLVTTEMPAHTHLMAASAAAANDSDPAGDVLAAATIYAAATSPTPMSSGVIAQAGGGEKHNNIQPSLVLNFIIALTGIFPSRN